MVINGIIDLLFAHMSPAHDALELSELADQVVYSTHIFCMNGHKIHIFVLKKYFSAQISINTDFTNLYTIH